MHKKLCVVAILIALTNVCFAQSRYYASPVAQKFFFDFNVLYDYERLVSDDDFSVNTNNLLFEIAIGYDFGRVIPKIAFDIGLPLSGSINFTDGTEDLTKVMDSQNFKLGLEVGLKPIDTNKFDLSIPLGIMFNWSTYTQKNPSYASGQPYDRVWAYTYINLYSGINATIQVNKHCKLGLFARGGYPVSKELEYKEVLQGNYVWTSNNSSTRSIKETVDVLNFSAGVGVLFNL